MIATGGKFNNASIRRALDTKYPSVMKKPNPIDYVFKDKAKFDVKNPVVGSLFAQVNENKKKDKAYLHQLSQAPSITDIHLNRRLKELRDFNQGRVNDDDDDDDDDDDNNTGSIIPRRSFFLPPTPPEMPPSSSREDDGLNPTQHFLLQRPQPERVTEAISQEPGPSKTTPERITFSDKIKRTFPISHEIMNETMNETIEEEPSVLDEINESYTISDIQSTCKGIKQR